VHEHPVQLLNLSMFDGDHIKKQHNEADAEEEQANE
jgi:hypothetical protein